MMRTLLGIILALAFFIVGAHEAEAKSGFRFSSGKSFSSFSFKPKPQRAKPVFISKSKHPESAKHVLDAQKAGAPKVLTVDRSGKNERRRQALAGTPTQQGKDRDEYPPAVTKEGGKNASVRHIAPSDNRGSGACLGAQCKDVPDGKKIRVLVTD